MYCVALILDDIFISTTVTEYCNIQTVMTNRLVSLVYLYVDNIACFSSEQPASPEVLLNVGHVEAGE